MKKAFGTKLRRPNSERKNAGAHEPLLLGVDIAWIFPFELRCRINGTVEGVLKVIGARSEVLEENLIAVHFSSRGSVGNVISGHRSCGDQVW